MPIARLPRERHIIQRIVAAKLHAGTAITAGIAGHAQQICRLCPRQLNLITHRHTGTVGRVALNATAITAGNIGMDIQPSPLCAAAVESGVIQH
ncbi:Uncharacterised protein [Yersinia enterocolitica]|nr:Uncharacterised protein [Yersinia enterocolitica]